MLIGKAYYLVKPLMPLRLRIALRRLFAGYKRRTSRDIWPIDEVAGTTPPNWPGWPERKRFALVLTHDVEGPKGVGRVERLMDLERRHGFRSSFNLVPEGSYRVPEDLRLTLNQNGFEVGVHGLEHDGKLYNSKAGFESKAAGIRRYLDQWQAVGFRSPLMQHKLSWLHELGVEYDCSTFDTDPFEPQPDGVRTVFPFWVPGPNGGGYVELPYSLVQDFNLFIVLREPNIEIWKRKLDWIAERGGMALLNTHPDYMCFDGVKQSKEEFPVAFYEEFLAYARDKYQDAFWQPLPREVSRYYCASVPPPLRNTRKKICMLAHTHYGCDNRVRRYAEALASRGDLVDVIALSSGPVVIDPAQTAGVTEYRIQRRDGNEKSKWNYAWRLLRFFATASIFLARRHNRVQYDLIHVHNIPDFLVFAAWYPRRTGAKVILDIHDIVPELFASKFGTGDRSLYFKFLTRIEKASATFSDHVIVANHLWQETLISRSVPKEKCSVFLNHVDPAIFGRRPRTRNDGKFVILFPGSFQWHQGLDLAIEAFALMKDRAPNADLHFYGGGGGHGAETDLSGLAARLGLNGRVTFHGTVALDQIADVMANADLGIVPKRANSFGNEAYSTKIMEFMSQGVPVVVSRTKIDSFYFDDSVVRFFPSGDISGMAQAMLEVIESKTTREALIAAGYEYAERHGWGKRKGDYLDLVDSLSTERFGDCVVLGGVPNGSEGAAQ
jgi:glycosyltransferase involved in cell wall biosynthesis